MILVRGILGDPSQLSLVQKKNPSPTLITSKELRKSCTHGMREAPSPALTTCKELTKSCTQNEKGGSHQIERRIIKPASDEFLSILTHQPVETI